MPSWEKPPLWRLGVFMRRASAASREGEGVMVREVFLRSELRQMRALEMSDCDTFLVAGPFSPFNNLPNFRPLLPAPESVRNVRLNRLQTLTESEGIL